MSGLTGECLEDRWEIGEEIGRGGFSVVYEAHDRALSKKVAVKVLVPPPARAEMAIERLRREARAVRTIQHPNIVPVFELVEREGRAFLIMELLSGGDLAKLVEAKGPLSVGEVRRLGRQIADALTATHERGVLHRDVKPQNILFSEDGRAFLTDFGSARVDGATTLTATGSVVGTLDYTAPEVLAGDPADPRADVYGLGLSLYYAAAGSLPKRGSAHLPPTPLDEGFCPPTSDSIGQVIARATTKSPALRFPTTESFAIALETESSMTRNVAALFCPLCGEDVGKEGRVCIDCKRRAPSAEAMTLFVSPIESTRTAQVARDLALTFALPATVANELIRGTRPLCQTRPTDVQRVTDRLRTLGLAAISRTRSEIYRQMPPSLLLVIFAVLGSGLALALTKGAWFGWLGPPLALTLFTMAHATLTRPVVAAALTRAPVFGPQTEQRIDETLSRISAMPVRRLLLTILDAAERSCAATDEPSLKREITDLVDATCPTAVHLDRLESAHEAISALEPKLQAEASSRVETTRARLSHQLLRGLEVLNRLEETEAQPSALAAVTESLALKDEALREVDAILGA